MAHRHSLLMVSATMVRTTWRCFSLRSSSLWFPSRKGACSPHLRCVYLRRRGKVQVLHCSPTTDKQTKSLSVVGVCFYLQCDLPWPLSLCEPAEQEWLLIERSARGPFCLIQVHSYM